MACPPGKWIKCVRFLVLWILRFILGGRVDAPQVYETCWNWFGGLGSMRFLYENNQLEYQGFGIKE